MFTVHAELENPTLGGELGRPIIMANNADIHILATSASNISTDALAVRLYRIIKEIGHQGQYCVRAHSGLKPPGGMIVDGIPTSNTADLIDEIGNMTVWKNVTIAE
jgi:hypothetical protein